MKKVLLLIVTASFLTGCASFHQMEASRNAVHGDLIAGLDKDNKFEHIVWSLGYPRNPAPPYRSIDYISTKISEGPYKGQNATFYLGKSRETGKWEVFFVMVQDKGKWTSLPVKRPEVSKEK